MLSDPNWSYELVPGQSVVIGTYTYTSPAGSTAGDVTLSSRASEGESSTQNLTPAVTLKNNDTTVDVALTSNTDTKSTYTAAEANTKFAMNSADEATTHVDLLAGKLSTANNQTVTGGTNTITSVEANTTIGLDSESNAKLISGKATLTGEATVEVGSEQVHTVSVPENKTYTIDTTEGSVSGLGENDSVTIDNVTYTSGTESGSFPLDTQNSKLPNTGDKAEVPGNTAATITLGEDSTPQVAVPSGNTGKTTITNGSPSSVSVEKAEDILNINDTAYKTTSNNTNVTIAEGANTLTLGGVELDTNESITFNNVPVTNTGDGTLTVTTTDGKTGTVVIPASTKASIGSAGTQIEATSSTSATVSITENSKLSANTPIIINDVEYTGAEETLTIDPTTGKVTGGTRPDTTPSDTTPSDATPSKPASSANAAATPRTGDESGIVYAFAALLISGAALCVSTVARRKNGMK